MSHDGYASNDFLAQFKGDRLKRPRIQCDVCGENQWTYDIKHTEDIGIEVTRFSIFRCAHCGFMRMLPLPTSEELAMIYGNYADHGDRLEVENWRAQEIYPAKLMKLSEMTRGRKLLDVGAGLGTFVYTARSMGFDATGIEYSADQCQRALEVYNVNLINDVIENWREHFDEKSFDIINLHHVFEHVIHPRAVLKILITLLAPRGILLIEVPNQFCDLRKKYFRRSTRNKYSGNPLHHVNFFCPKILVRLLESEGFETIECNQFRPESTIEGGAVRTAAVRLYRTLVERYRIGGGHIIEGYFRSP